MELLVFLIDFIFPIAVDEKISTMIIFSQIGFLLS